MFYFADIDEKFVINTKEIDGLEDGFDACTIGFHKISVTNESRATPYPLIKWL